MGTAHAVAMTKRKPSVPKARQAVGEKASIEALMHGIFAITMTLLILELRVPETEPGRLWHSLLELGPEVAGYLFGFVYLMTVWLSLREFVRELNGITSSVSVLFLLVVGLVSLTPFTVATMATAIGDDADLGIAVRLMASVVCVGFLLSAVMAKVALRQGLVPPTPWFLTPWPMTMLMAGGPAALGFVLSYVNPWLGIAVISVDIVLGLVMVQSSSSEGAPAAVS